MSNTGFWRCDLGIESLQRQKTFGIEELGLLDSDPVRSLDTIVALCAEAMRVPVVALFVFDDRAGALAVRSLVGETGIRPGSLNVPTFQTATSISRGKSGLFAVSNLASRKDTRDAAERQKFGATGYLGAPINGPAGDVVGVLAAMTMTEHQWTRRERRLITSYAYLAYEQIMLRAALNTVKLMAEEQQAVESVVSYTN